MNLFRKLIHIAYILMLGVLTSLGGLSFLYGKWTKFIIISVFAFILRTRGELK